MIRRGANLWRQHSSWDTPGLPKSRPRDAKVKENSKMMAKMCQQSHLGMARCEPQRLQWWLWSPFWVPKSRRWGLWASFCLPIGCSDFTFSHCCCDVVFFLDLIIVFYWFWVWILGRIFMFSIAGGAPFSSMILVRFFLSLRIAFCIGKTSARCVLHNKDNGFYTFNVFGQIRFLMYFIDSDIDFAIHFLDGFHGTSKFLEV